MTLIAKSTLKDTLLRFLKLIIIVLLFMSGYANDYFPGRFFLGPPLALAILFNEISSFKGIIKKNLYNLLVSLLFYLISCYWIIHISSFGMNYGGVTKESRIFFFVLFNSIPLIFFNIIEIPFIKKIAMKSRKDIRYLTYAILFTFLEIYTPQIFPLASGNGWIEFSPYLKLAQIFGQPIFSFINCLFAFIFYEAIFHKTILKKMLILACVLSTANFVAPIFYEKREDKTLNIRLVQPFTDGETKHYAELGNAHFISEIKEKLIVLSTALLKKKSPDLIIWPETSYPGGIIADKINSGLEPIDPFLMAIPNQLKSHLILGSYNYEIENGQKKRYNTAFHLSPHSKKVNFYNKNILIPFGETLPFGPFNKYLDKKKGEDKISVGKEPTLFSIKEKEAFFSIIICLEVLYPRFVRRTINHFKKAPTFLILLTNDYWYGDSLAPLQTINYVKWRSIEFNMPIVRSSTSGISKIIYPDGSHLKELGIYKQGFLDDTLYMKQESNKSLFHQWGYLNISVLFILSFLLFLFPRSKVL